MKYEIFYAQPEWQNEVIYIVKVNTRIERAYSRALKSQGITLEPAPTFEFYEDNGLDKFTIDSKADF